MFSMTISSAWSIVFLIKSQGVSCIKKEEEKNSVLHMTT